MSRFLDLDFVPLTLDHQKDLEGFLKRYPNRLSGYTFASLVCWNHLYHHQWTFFEPNILLISTYDWEHQHTQLIQPEGEFNQRCADHILQHAPTLTYPLKLMAVSSPFVEEHTTFCSHFKHCSLRQLANYVYRAVDLALLEGRRYAKKRNLLAQAEEIYHWTVEPLNESAHHDCCQILMDIQSEEHYEMTEGLTQELAALKCNLAHFEALRQKGCLIRIEGRPVAFSIYEEITPSTCVIHFEKAERQYKGLYQLINRETAKAILNEGYTYINREEDMGLEGLRQAKESYHPVALIPSHTLTWKS